MPDDMSVDALCHDDVRTETSTRPDRAASPRQIVAVSHMDARHRNITLLQLNEETAFVGERDYIGVNARR
jgi:hypothetical protein